MKPDDSDSGTPEYLVAPEDAPGYRLLQNYLTRRRGEMALFRDALKREDYPVIRRMGHNLRGSGASYDLVRVSVLGAEIELAAERCAPDRIARLITDLEDFLSRVTIIEPA